MATTGSAAIPQVRHASAMRIDETMWHEAQDKVAPILQRAGEKGLVAVMFLALVELQKHYPSLSEHDLEALLHEVMKHSGPAQLA